MMKMIRVIRHLLFTHWQVNRAFPRGTLIAIEKAIKTCDSEHIGEIRFAVEGALHSALLFHDQTARERAVEVFSQLRVWDTEHNNGVLIYVLLADRAVEIVADRGVHAKTSSQDWRSVCGMMETAFRRAEYRAGAISGIQAVAQHLRKHFPASGDTRNELAEAPVVL
jgi:uncharacterized membrane protein